MSFAFRPDDRSVQAAVRRIARAELRATLRRLQAGRAGDADIHALRKHIKKLRGLLRLVRPVFDGFGPANATLRAAAFSLAPLREAEVRLATLRALAADLPADAPPGLADPALAALAAEAQSGAVAPLPAAAAQALADLQDQARRWKIAGDGWQALAPGLTATWRAARQGRRRAARALEDGQGWAAFHDWRKAVKHHWYQARLLEPVWPAMLAPQIAAADRLGEDLGALQDLDILLAHLAAHPDPGVAALAQDGPLLRLAQGRQRALASSTLAQGARLFADRPEALTRRWGKWWAAWRAGA